MRNFLQGWSGAGREGFVRISGDLNTANVNAVKLQEVSAGGAGGLASADEAGPTGGAGGAYDCGGGHLNISDQSTLPVACISTNNVAIAPTVAVSPVYPRHITA